LVVTNLTQANEQLLDNWDDVLRISICGKRIDVPENEPNKRHSQKTKNDEITPDYSQVRNGSFSLKIANSESIVFPTNLWGSPLSIPQDASLSFWLRPTEGAKAPADVAVTVSLADQRSGDFVANPVEADDRQ
jgi:hypothetical protein